MTSAENAAFTREQFDLAYPEGIARHFWTVARAHIVRRKALDGRSGGVLLDVGCGRGLTVEALRAAGAECYGVDLGRPPVAEEVRPHLFLEQDAFELPGEFRRCVGTLLLLDVLEHLDDPGAFLLRCRGAFPAAGRLVATVPARREIWSNYDDFYGHRRRYDRPSLRRLLEETGPSRLRMGYFFHLLYPALRLRLLAGSRPVRHQAPRRPALHALLARVFVLEERLAPRGWAGTSLWAVADFDGETSEEPARGRRKGVT